MAIIFYKTSSNFTNNAIFVNKLFYVYHYLKKKIIINNVENCLK